MPGGSRDRPELMPCIWVNAGILSYRLCDREYDCEGCDLFHALRGGLTPPDPAGPGSPTPGQRPADGVASPSDDVDRYFCVLLAGCALRIGRYYGPGHLWVSRERADEVVLGLDGHVLRVLRPIDDVQPPRVGTWLRRPEACGWIVRGHRSIPLQAPLAGEVIAVNTGYADAVARPAPAEAGDDWLMRLRPHESPDAVPDLARGEEALVRYLRDLRLIKQALRAVHEESDRGVVGAALPDGGAPETDLERVLGAGRFETLVGELFHVQIS